MAMLDMIQHKAFLGLEFGTWLWFRSEQNEGSLDLGKGRGCSIAFEKNLVLSCEAGYATDSTLRGDAPAESPEAAAALLQNKKIKRARVSMTVDDLHYEFSLNAENFDWSSLKLDVPGKMELDEALPIRLEALERFQQVFGELFTLFLNIRLDETAWKKEIVAMRSWVTDKGSKEEE